MTYSKIQFARDLQKQLDLGYEPKRIGSWAHSIYMQHCGEIDKELDEIIADLCLLEEGPQFELPESNLRELVQSLMTLDNRLEEFFQGKILEKQNVSIQKTATELDSNWLMCPECIDAWESVSEDSVVICPKCDDIFLNPRYIPYDSKISLESDAQSGFLNHVQDTWKSETETITDKRCIKLMKENFPNFPSYWENYIRDFGPGLGLIIEMLPFGQYAIDVIKSNNETAIKQIFDFVEFLLSNGDDSVQTAMTTSFLEYLMSNDPDEIKFSKFAQYLGQNAISYCRAWDQFTGVRTEGLWKK